VRSLLLALLTALMFSPGCGGGSSASQANSGLLSSNWQFTMNPPSDGSYTGGLQGGFLLQNGSSVAGSIVYAITNPAANPAASCAAGSAPVVGSADGHNVHLTVVAGAQTFTFSGTLSGDGTTMMGTYSSTGGPPLTGGGQCGTAQTGLQWSALSVPPLTGTFQGSFHSGTGTRYADEDFTISGNLFQSYNTGSSSATVTGTLSAPGYPCFDNASLNGTISGSSVNLRLIGTDGLDAGQIGPAIFEKQSNGNGYLLRTDPLLSANSLYTVNTKSCSQGMNLQDSGAACLGIGSANGCTQPVSFSAGTIAFPPQLLGSSPTTQSITLSNTDPGARTLSLTLQLNPGFTDVGDFNNQPSFAEQDTCGSSPFSLGAGQSCTIVITFAPQESCTWNPLSTGTPPVLCPRPLTATLSLLSSVDIDGNSIFTVPISGTGLSAIVPDTPELDFGSETPSETSAPQRITFSNQSPLPVQVLSAPNCVFPLVTPLVLGSAPGLQVVNVQSGSPGQMPVGFCDVDPNSQQPNFQIISDACSGKTLAPQESCLVGITFAPQPGTNSGSGLDYFLELNTLQCTNTTTFQCEIDAGRFPVELKSNPASPIRMTPAASLTFAGQSIGSTSAPQTVTLYNDPKDPNTKTLIFDFQSIVANGEYAQTNTCGTALSPGGTCTVSVTFTPIKAGLRQGTVVISPTNVAGGSQTIFLRGTGNK
jgi:hypothetical protein